jgi:hypothetical protein
METKKIRSRSNKNPGEILEDKWRIVEKTVIAPPFAGDPRHGVPPRQGIYDYDCVPASDVKEEPAPKRAPRQASSPRPTVSDPPGEGAAGGEAREPIITFRRITR